MKLLYLDRKQTEKETPPQKSLFERKRPKTISYLVLFKFLFNQKFENPQIMNQENSQLKRAIKGRGELRRF